MLETDRRVVGVAALSLVLCLTALVQPAVALDPAGHALQPGEFRLDCEAGYAEYAFPIGDAALARTWTAYRIEKDQVNWASRGDMAYQLAYDYSVVPVYFRIEHRRPDAFSGTIELETAHGYGVAEDPIGHRTLWRHDFVAPPSVPIEFTLTPRVAPTVRPGKSERIVVRVFQKGISIPIHQRELTVTQLEPAHLYSLVLDDPAVLQAPLPPRQEINPGNYLQLAVPANRTDIVLDPSIYGSSHYFLGVPHRAVTGAPLAARQFAFVLAQFANVKRWTEHEQDALLSYVLGGGRLILYAASGAEWRGCPLHAPVPVGRGWLIPVRGDLPQAQAIAKVWLEGEMQEFALYARGTVNGVALDEDFYNSYIDTNVQLDEVYASAPLDSAPEPISHRAGYLHPLWLYRTAVDRGAIEPWDYPEFTHFSSAEARSNVLLRSILATQPDTRPPVSLAKLLTERRHLPPWWLPALIGLTLMLVGFAAPLPRSILFAHRIGAGLLAGLAAGLWQGVQPLPHPHGRMQLVDYDASVQASLARSIDAEFCSERACGFTLQPGSLLRRVDWQPAGNWQVTSATTAEGTEPALWQGEVKHAGPYAAVRSDSSTASEELGFSATAEPIPGGYRIVVNTAGLPADQLIVAQSALGFTALKAAPSSVKFYLYLPRFPSQPGLQRALALEALTKRYGQQIRSLKSATNWQSRVLLTQLLQDGWTPELKRGSPQAEVQRLGWSAILQDPVGGRGLPLNQVVLYTVTPQAPDTSSTNTVGATWARYCMRLP